MKITKVALGDGTESFIESNLSSGLNIISSDDNNKGKTILIQSMMYALGNDPTFPTSFDYKKYYHYVEFEVGKKQFLICRYNDSFVVKPQSSIMFFDSVSELKRYWTKNIFPLPSIVKNEMLRIVDPVLFFQIFFVGQDKKDTSNIAHAGFYNKNDFINMLYAFYGLGEQELDQNEVEMIKSQLYDLKDERKLLLKQHKILKSTKTPVSYLSTNSDREAFSKKVVEMEKINGRITELRKSRNASATRRAKWDATIKELRSLNRTMDFGELRCMDCDSTNIAFSASKNSSYAFDVSTSEMRSEIINSIEEKISAYSEEIEKLEADIATEQKLLQEYMSDDSISLESIVAYKQEIFSATDAETRIKEIDNAISEKKSKLTANENATQNTKDKRAALLSGIIALMDKYYKTIDPKGNLTFDSLFTKQNEVYSGSESTIFHFVKLLALRNALEHPFPIIIDSFRAEDLSTEKESRALDLLKSFDNQFILTTTLKKEEMGKYDHNKEINHIDYSINQPSKLLNSKSNNDFKLLLLNLSIKL